MSLIEGGKVSDAAWLKLTNFLLAICIALGAWFANRALDKLDLVVDSVIRHDVQIEEIKRRLEAMEIRRGRAEVLPSDLDGMPGKLHFRGRGGGGRGERPSAPSSVPEPPAPKPEPKTAPPKADGHDAGQIIEIHS